MKNLFLFLITFTFSNLYSQTDYFEGKRNYCELSENERIKEIFPLGIKCVQNRQYLGSAIEIFTDVIKIDATFCDAYFWAGYAFRLSNMNKEAVAMYYIADSLAQNKSIEFKQNLASTSMIIGADSLARRKFEEIKEYFPNSPEGFYGVALTSTKIGDVIYGLENINIAENKYNEPNEDAQLLKAILLTLNEKYSESISYYEKIENKFSKLDHFNGNYALSLYEIGSENKDEKSIKLAKKYYNKVRKKEELTEYIRSKFEN